MSFTVRNFIIFLFLPILTLQIACAEAPGPTPEVVSEQQKEKKSNQESDPQETTLDEKSSQQENTSDASEISEVIGKKEDEPVRDTTKADPPKTAKFELGSIFHQGGKKAERLNGVTVDQNGNYIIHAHFTGELKIGHITLKAKSENATQQFLSKIRKDGKVLWARKLSLNIKKLVADSKGNIYVTGGFFGTQYIGTTKIKASGLADMVVAKFNSSGTPVWTKEFGSTGNGDNGAYLALDGDDELYVVGMFEKKIATAAGRMESKGSTDILVLKFDKDGTVLWAKGMGGSASDYATSIAVNAKKEVVLTGYTRNGRMKVGNPARTQSGEGFVIKLDKDGKVEWTYSYGETGSLRPIALGRASSCVFDSKGNVFVAGEFKGKLRTGAKVLSASSDTDVDLYLFKLDARGRRKWSISVGSSKRDFLSPIQINKQDELFLAGVFSQSMDWKGTTISTKTLTNGFFFAKLTTDGKLLGHKTMDVGANSLTVDSGMYQGKSLYVAGDLFNAVMTGDETLTSEGQSDVFYLHWK